MEGKEEEMGGERGGDGRGKRRRWEGKEEEMEGKEEEIGGERGGDGRGKEDDGRGKGRMKWEGKGEEKMERCWCNKLCSAGGIQATPTGILNRILSQTPRCCLYFTLSCLCVICVTPTFTSCLLLSPLPSPSPLSSPLPPPPPPSPPPSPLFPPLMCLLLPAAHTHPLVIQCPCPRGLVCQSPPVEGEWPSFCVL